MSLVTVQLVLSLLTIKLLSKHLNFLKSIAVVTLFSLEPFFVGNSRLFHMDILLSLLIFLSLLMTLEHLKKPSVKTGVITGFLFSLSMLTKSVAIGGIIYAILAGLVVYIPKKDWKNFRLYMRPLILSFLIFTPLVFPALLRRPIFVLSDIVYEMERVGIRKGHDQIIFGKETMDGGLIFYPLVLLLKLSPFIMVGVLVYCLMGVCAASAAIQSFTRKHGSKVSLSDLVDVVGEGTRSRPKKRHISLFKVKTGTVLFLSIFYIGYFLVMLYPAKKLDRYMLPLYPWLALLSTLGYSYVFKILTRQNSMVRKKAFVGLVSFFALIFVVTPLVEQFPYYFTYTNPLFGDTSAANKIVGQKPFGVGMVELKAHIMEGYSGENPKVLLPPRTEPGDYPRLGFYDTKPMSAIYPNTKIVDVRINGTSDYELLILGPNEPLPEEVIQGKLRFDKSSSVYINGLEYWRIYVKRES